MSEATRWTRTKDGPSIGQGVYVCECGAERILSDKQQRSQRRSLGCGCQRHAIFRHRPAGPRQGGLEATPEYGSWRAMRRRCNDPSRRSFARYGGRGIRVCARWDSFEAFYADMGPRPVGMTLDRIDNDGDYSPENCRWATASDQNSNRDDNRLITYEGKTLTITQWAAELGVSPRLLDGRTRYGWSVKDTLTVPSGGRRGQSVGSGKKAGRTGA